MPNCTRCGATMEGLDAGGNMICDNCEASMHGGGSGTDVPCQRCGMYLPSHELQMWNSRLYCAYCIMDIKDEEKRTTGEGRPQEGAPENPTGGILGGLFGTRDAPPQQPEKSGGEPLQQYTGTKSGTCERCGRESDVLYSAHGLNVCPACYFSGGATGSSPSFMGQIVSRIKSAVGLGDRPKIIQSQPKLVFDIGTRKMVEQVAKPKAIEPANPDAAEKPFAPSAGEAPLTRQQSVFNVRDRKLVGKKEGMAAEQPISEGAQEEKKPAPKAKKLFFKMHPSGGGGAKKK